MTTPADDELARQSERLAREAEAPPAITHSFRCATHGPQYTCARAVMVGVHSQQTLNFYPHLCQEWRLACGHTACRHIANQRCPECQPGAS